MDTEVVMSLTAGLAAFVGVFASIVALKQKQSAEREFLHVLVNATAATRLREIRSKITEDGAVKLMNRAGIGSGSLPVAIP